MTRSFATLLIGLGLVTVAACGRKGPLVVPRGRTPMPVETLTAALAGGTIVLRWTNPTKEISGRPLGPLGAVEVWVFDKGLPAGSGPLTSEAIERTARLARKIPGKEIGASGVMTYSYALPATAAAPEKLAFAVRVFDAKGRASDFSAPVAVAVARKDAGVDPPAAEGVS
ncbi:MAG: lipoprotein [Candidatus Aminicenantales bacterium]